MLARSGHWLDPQRVTQQQQHTFVCRKFGQGGCATGLWSADGADLLAHRTESDAEKMRALVEHCGRPATSTPSHTTDCECAGMATTAKELECRERCEPGSVLCDTVMPDDPHFGCKCCRVLPQPPPHLR